MDMQKKKIYKKQPCKADEGAARAPLLPLKALFFFLLRIYPLARIRAGAKASGT